MTVSLENDVITLSGSCGAEEVEPLVNCLEARPGLTVNIAAATAIHTAVWQALMVFRPVIKGSPDLTNFREEVFNGIAAYIREKRNEES